MAYETLAAEPARKMMALRDGAVSYLEWKSGADLPPLHFAHANGFNGQTYRTLLGPLASRFHIRAWDARGHGMSELPTDIDTHKDWYVYRDDLIAFLERFAEEAGQPVLLAGHSMGGTASLMAAAERPDLVSGICFIDPVLVPARVRRMMKLTQIFGLPMRGFALAEGAARRRAVWPGRAELVEAYRGRGAFRTWPEAFLKDYVDGGTKVLETGDVALACQPAWESANFRAHGHDPWDAIDRLACPLTLIYAGEGSTCTPPGPARLAARDPRATITKVGEATHFLPMEFPERVRLEITSLQARLERLAAAS